MCLCPARIPEKVPGSSAATPEPRSGTRRDTAWGHVHATSHTSQHPQPPPATAAQSRFTCRGSDAQARTFSSPHPLFPPASSSLLPSLPSHPVLASPAPRCLRSTPSSLTAPPAPILRLVTAKTVLCPACPLPRMRRPERRRLARSPPRAGPGCPSWLCFAAVTWDMGPGRRRPPPALWDARAEAVTALPCCFSPRQGLRLPQQPAVPRAPGAPRGHRQREGRGEGLSARGRPSHLR